MTSARRRLLAGCLAAALVLTPLAWWWHASLLPAEYSVMDMGYLDYGGGPHGRMAGHGRTGEMPGMGAPGPADGSVSVADLVDEAGRPADVRVDLVARKQAFRLASGRTVDGYTVNGRSPGPRIDVTEGQLLEVHLTNASVPDGITLHWHGVDVPNAEDGVAGVTQDAVGAGEQHTYRFVADHAGTFWYHPHQVWSPWTGTTSAGPPR